MIHLEGNTDDISIYNKDIPIIGFSNSTVYHLMFKTEMSDLNYWDIMIEMLCERFLIFNPKHTIKGKNMKKFKGKTIQSYVFILKQNKFIKYEWDWDMKYNIEIKELFKDAIIKHFSQTNKQLFQYCSFVKSSEIWKKESKTPFEYIAKQFDNSPKVPHIRDFFKLLHEQSKTNKQHVLRIVNSEELFLEELSKKTDEMCDSFFNLNVITDDEW